MVKSFIIMALLIASSAFGRDLKTEWYARANQDVLSGLISRWAMQSDPIYFSPWKVIDSSTTGAHGVQTNDIQRPVFLTDRGGCLNFDGVNDFVSLQAVTSSISTLIVGTVCGWVKLNQDTNIQQKVFSITRSSGTRYEFQFSLDMRLTSFRRYDAFVEAGGSMWRWWGATNEALSAVSNFVHFAITHNGTAPVVYINGVSAEGAFVITTDKTRWFSSLFSASSVVRLGSANESGTELFMDGKLDDVRIYNRALTSNEVYQIYHRTR